MAAYEEIAGIYSTADRQNLLSKIMVAVTIKAQTFIDGGAPTADQMTWASRVLTTPQTEAEKIMRYVLAANNTATLQAITGATDSTIQSNVDAAVDALVGAGITS